MILKGTEAYMSDSKLLSVNEVANRISVSGSMVYALIEKGMLKCHRIGRCIRVSESQIADYLESCEVDSGLHKTHPRRELKHLDN